MNQRLFKKGFVFVLILLLARVAVSSKELVNDEKTTIVAPEDYNNLLTQVKTNKDYSRGWIEEEQLLASDGETWDWFAHSVSISGDYAITGSSYNEDMGSAYIFKYNGTSWVEEQKLTASDGEIDKSFGCSVSINGNYALIGAIGDDDSGHASGSAYIFKYNGTSWVEGQKLTASDGETQDVFGESVSIINDRALIGALGDDDYQGSAYIFKYNGTSWVEEQKLLASDGEESDFFGRSVSIDGNYALIGAEKDDDVYVDEGAAYVFKYDGVSWVQEQKLLASDGEEYDNFGKSVSINDNRALIGSFGTNDNGVESGSAYVFKYDDGSWVEEQKLTALDGSDYDWFGYSVSIYNQKAVIGARCDDEYQGSAYIFNYDGVSWNQEQKLFASDGNPLDEFGWSVSINNDKAIIGAPQYYNYMGSAYVFAIENLTIPDLNCIGNINLEDVTPGETVVDIFRVQNIGGQDTLLNWEIESYPDWGDWTFIPDSGTGLTPEDGYFEVEVSIVAPDEKNENFHGEILIVNSDDSGDTCIIDVSIATPENHQSVIFQFLERISDECPRTFPLFRILFDL